MNLFRVFDWDRSARGSRSGGPLYVPRSGQGSGRYDLPHRDGIFYGSLNAVSAVAEAVQVYRNQKLTDDDFQIEAVRIQALASLTLSPDARVVDLTRAEELVRRSLQPADIATHDRSVSQRVAALVFEEGADGFLWWSALEASWTNVTLFQSRIVKKLTPARSIQPLNTKLPELVHAAKFLKIHIS